MSTRRRRAVPRPSTRRRPAIALAVAVASLLLPGQALAKNEVTRFFAGPIPQSTHCNPNVKPEQMLTTAAARTDMCIAFYVDGGDPAKGDDVKETVAETPQGFYATADSSPSCTLAQLMPDRGDAARCPAGAQVGEAEVRVRVDLGSSGLLIPQVVHGKLWNVEHSPDEVARLALELAPEIGGIQMPHIKVMARTVLRPNPDVGLRTMFEGQPRQANLGALGTHPIAIDGIFLRLWGAKADHPSLTQDFGLLGSDCENDQVARMKSVSWSGDTDDAEYRYKLTDCENVPFDVNASVETVERRPDVPTATKVTVSIPQNEFPRVTGNMKKTVLTLPAGLEMGAQIASGAEGLPLCKAGQFGWDRLAASDCPAASKVADINIISPLQVNEFKGAAYLGEQPAAGELPQLFVEGGFGSKPDSPRVKLRGKMAVDENGRITSTLDNLPQVLFREFSLTFKGGDHAAMITPRQCGTTTGSIEATPASTGKAIVKEIPLTIDEDCIDPGRFEPSMTISTSNPQAGGRTVLKVKTSRPDRTARISKMVANLPQGILSDLKLATECTGDQAAAAACPESSRVGTVTAESGVGPKPQTVTGDVYLGQRQEGAVAGIIIATKVAFGDVDLGRLNLPARVELRPGDLGLRLTADVPQRFKGLSLNLRSFEVALDRPDFAINPTNCAPLTSTSNLFSDQGTSADVPLTLQVSGCDKLAFDPSLSLALTGKMAHGDKPNISVTVGLGQGGSNIKSTAVMLPTGLGADLDQVKRACPGAAWDAGTCGADAIIGNAQATIAITDEVITGKVSMVKVEGQTLPGVGIQLEGRFASRLLGKIAVDQATTRLVTRFDSLPDVPISQLKLNLEGGARGALISTKSLCANGGKISMQGNFTGQSGATAQREAVTQCSGVQVAGALLVKASGSTRGTLKLKFTAPSGKKLKTVKFTLPSGVTVAAKKVAKNKVLRGTSTAKLSGKRTIEGRVASAGTATYTVTIPKGALVLSKAAKKKKAFSTGPRVTYTDGTRDTATVTFKR